MLRSDATLASKKGSFANACTNGAILMLPGAYQIQSVLSHRFSSNKRERLCAHRSSVAISSNGGLMDTSPDQPPDNAPHNHQEGTTGLSRFTGSSGVRK